MNLSKDIIGIVYKYLLPLKNYRIKNECLNQLKRETLSIWYDLNHTNIKFVRYRISNRDKILYLSRFR